MRRVVGWVPVEQSSPVGFRVVIEQPAMARAVCSCAHIKGYMFFNDDCRPCQVNKAIYDSGLQWERDINEELYQITLTGRCVTDAQKIALTRLMALVRGDMEPLKLVEARSFGLIR